MFLPSGSGRRTSAPRERGGLQDVRRHVEGRDGILPRRVRIGVAGREMDDRVRLRDRVAPATAAGIVVLVRALSKLLGARRVLVHCHEW